MERYQPYLIFLLVLLIARVCRRFFRRGRHGRNRKRAKFIYRKRLTNPGFSAGQRMAYLKEIDPYVFEELVLDGFERKGFRAIRNERYSGDGGIDGRLEKDGKLYLVQCKRYDGYINAADVSSFVNLCNLMEADGFFVHTGKTGRKSWELTGDGPVKIVSGERLLDLVTGT